MSEDLLQYVWQHQLYEKGEMLTVDNQKVEVISPGIKNTDAGPDFLNARIKLDGIIWAGNVEVHNNSSDWKKHKHHSDKAYNNVILHVVRTYSEGAYNASDKEVPTLKMNMDKDVLNAYASLSSSHEPIACSKDIHVIDDFSMNMWLERLCVERLEDKTALIKDLLEQNRGNWEECFYIFLAKSFGFKTNSLPFEMMARLTPLKIVSKYSNNLFQLEALLFGQAGFLEETTTDEYQSRLRNEYEYLKKVHNLKSVDKHLWKFLRLRPYNFPTIRIAQFATLINKSKRLFSKIIEAQNIKELNLLLECVSSEYWKAHYNFGTESAKKIKKLGASAINGLLINTIIPFLFIYGKERGLQGICTRATDFLETLKEERNSIITKWGNINIKAKNALQSQALIQLYNSYCTEKNCLYCQIGNKILLHRN